MRCKACDRMLQDSESGWRKDVGCFEDLCSRCRLAAKGWDMPVYDEDVPSEECNEDEATED
jgi:hypothetical protein